VHVAKRQLVGLVPGRDRVNPDFAEHRGADSIFAATTDPGN
jgi:hypothetical protein